MKTSPAGTIAMMLATAATAASRQVPSSIAAGQPPTACICPLTTIAAIGSRASDSQRTTRAIPRPPTTKDPLSSSRPTAALTGSASPASKDSSTSISEHEQVAENDVGHRTLHLLALASHENAGSLENRQPSQGALGPQLLHDPDHRVRDHEESEQGVLPRAQ
jgi:hypothetical protein